MKPCVKKTLRLTTVNKLRKSKKLTQWESKLVFLIRPVNHFGLIYEIIKYLIVARGEYFPVTKTNSLGQYEFANMAHSYTAKHTKIFGIPVQICGFRKEKKAHQLFNEQVFKYSSFQITYHYRILWCSFSLVDFAVAVIMFISSHKTNAYNNL